MTQSSDPALSRYIRSVHKSPQLTREAELELSRRYASSRDPEAREQLVEAHLRYVVAIALKYRRYGLPLAELIAEGNLGVMHALDKFEPERGLRFVTYAAYWIRAYVLNYIIRSWSLVGVGSGALRSKMFFKLRRERVRVHNLLGDGPEADEALAARLQMPTEKVAAMMQRIELRDVSLDAKVYDDSATTLVDTLPSPDTDQEQVVIGRKRRAFVTEVVRNAITVLDERERYIVQNRLMADAESQLSLAEIGRRLGVSRERARQIESRAKRKLRTRLDDYRTGAGRDWLELDAAA
jgi:RNA polymerase sigma-32 factor